MRLLSLCLLAACGTAPTSPEPAPAEAPVEAPAPEPAGHGHDHGDEGDAAVAMPAVPDGAKVMFVSPADGATVSSPVAVKMGAEGIEVKAAGEVVEGTGHHHILVDCEPVASGTVVPSDEQHIHFGKGQTEAELVLEPGKHTLMLQLADGIHRSYGEQLSTKIEITVE